MYSKVTCLYMCIYLLFFKKFSHLHCYIILSRVQFCYTVGPCWLSILNIAVCTCQSQIPYYPFPQLVTQILANQWHHGSFYGDSFQVLGSFEFKLIPVSVIESLEVKWIGYFYMFQGYSQFGKIIGGIPLKYQGLVR